MTEGLHENANDRNNNELNLSYEKLSKDVWK